MMTIMRMMPAMKRLQLPKMMMVMMSILLLLPTACTGTGTVAAQRLSSSAGNAALVDVATLDVDDSSIQHYRDLQDANTNANTNTTTANDEDVAEANANADTPNDTTEPTYSTSNTNRGKELTASILSNVFLFFLIFGLSATVEMRNLKQQLQNRFAILCGVSMQYGIMPILGFVSVVLLRNAGGVGLTQAMGLSLLVVTSSPGGSYSNWWCSTFNADLALSVAMTTVSSLMSVFMLPLNLFFYTWLAYGAALQAAGEESVVKAIDFKALFFSLAIVMAAISSGLYCGYRWDNATFHTWANRGGSVSGILLILFGLFLSTGNSSGSESKLWNQGWAFYVAVAFPCLLGMLLANIIARSLARLSHPETVAIAIECCYQNTGIATSVAITMFDNPQDRAQAIAVPILYGIVEAVAICIYCLVAWKLGWTKAPPNENFCVVITKSYEVVEHGNEAEEILNDTSGMVIAQGGADHQDVSLISSDTTRFSNEQLQVSSEEGGVLIVPSSNARSSTATNTTTLMNGSMETFASEHDNNKLRDTAAASTPATAAGDAADRPFWSRIVPAIFLRPRALSSSTASESMAGSDIGGVRSRTSSIGMDQQQQQQRNMQEGDAQRLRNAELASCLCNRLASDYTAETVASSSNNVSPILTSQSLSEKVAREEEEAVPSADTTDLPPTAAAHHLTIPQLHHTEATTSATAAADGEASVQPKQQQHDDDSGPSAVSPKYSAPRQRA